MEVVILMLVLLLGAAKGSSDLEGVICVVMTVLLTAVVVAVWIGYEQGPDSPVLNWLLHGNV